MPDKSITFIDTMKFVLYDTRIIFQSLTAAMAMGKITSKFQPMEIYAIIMSLAFVIGLWRLLDDYKQR